MMTSCADDVMRQDTDLIQLCQGFSLDVQVSSGLRDANDSRYMASHERKTVLSKERIWLDSRQTLKVSMSINTRCLCIFFRMKWQPVTSDALTICRRIFMLQ
jgi:hypothetical protein